MRRLRCLFPLLAALLFAAPALCADGPTEESLESLIEEAGRIAAGLPSPQPAQDPEIARAAAFLENRQYLESLAVLRDIIRKQPDHAQARFIAANALIQLRRYDAARVLLEQLLEKHPHHAGLLNNLAWLYATSTDPMKRDSARAVELARRAILHSPDDYHIWSTLAEAHYANGEYPRALRAAEEALKLGHEKSAAPRQLLAYAEQVNKCRKAVLAFTIVD